MASRRVWCAASVIALVCVGILVTVLYGPFSGDSRRGAPLEDRRVIAEILRAHRTGEEYPRLEITYPFHETLFPPQIIAPTFRWKDEHAEADTWLVWIRFKDGRDGVFHLAGRLVRIIRIHRQNPYEEFPKHLMPADHVLGRSLSLLREGYQVVRRVVHQAFAGQGVQGPGDRGPAHAHPLADVLGPRRVLFRDDVEDGLQVVFQACAEYVGCCQEYRRLSAVTSRMFVYPNIMRVDEHEIHNSFIIFGSHPEKLVVLFGRRPVHGPLPRRSRGLDPALWAGAAVVSPSSLARFSGLILRRVRPFQSLMRGPIGVMFSLVADVGCDPGKVLAAETDNAVTRLPGQHVAVCNPMVDKVAAGSLQLADPLTWLYRRGAETTR